MTLNIMPLVGAMEKENLGSRLKALIKKKGLSVRKASQLIGVPQATLNSMVNGRPPGRLDHLIAIAEYFDLSLDEIIFGKRQSHVVIEEGDLTDVFDGYVKLRIQKIAPSKIKSK